MTFPRYTKLVQSLPATVPFVGPEEQERASGTPFLARLGANENIFGPSPKAKAALIAAADEIWMYGDPTSHDLRQALATHNTIDSTNIVVGEGIDGLLGYLVRLIIEPGDSVVTSAGAYPTFNYHVAGFGGKVHTVPYADDHEDPHILFTKAKDVRAKLVYLANPDNPMGTWHKGAFLTTALDGLPEGCLLVLDEAYVELAPPGTAAAIDVEDPRVIRMRTFSKAYGMAGARVGYAMGAASLIQSFDKIRNHFGTNRAAQAAAMAAVQDQDWLKQICQLTKDSRARIAQIASENGLRALPSATNFVTVDCCADGAFAHRVLNGLIKQGLFVRMPFTEPQNRCIRISCGPHSDMQLLAQALPHALYEAQI